MLYKYALDEFAMGRIRWRAHDGSNIKAVLVDTTIYHFDVSHRVLLDIPEPARVSAPQPLFLKDPHGGVCDAEDAEFSCLSMPRQVGGVVLYNDMGRDEVSPLIAFINQSDSLPGTVCRSCFVRWNNGPEKIFKL